MNKVKKFIKNCKDNKTFIILHLFEFICLFIYCFILEGWHFVIVVFITIIFGILNYIEGILKGDKNEKN